jgi:hypothetical protein
VPLLITMARSANNPTEANARTSDRGPGTFGVMISDALLKEAWVVAAMMTLKRVRFYAKVIRMRKQIANGITIAITDKSRRALSTEIGTLR